MKRVFWLLAVGTVVVVCGVVYKECQLVGDVRQVYFGREVRSEVRRNGIVESECHFFCSLDTNRSAEVYLLRKISPECALELRGRVSRDTFANIWNEIPISTLYGPLSSHDHESIDSSNVWSVSVSRLEEEGGCVDISQNPQRMIVYGEVVRTTRKLLEKVANLPGLESNTIDILEYSTSKLARSRSIQSELEKTILKGHRKGDM